MNKKIELQVNISTARHSRCLRYGAGRDKRPRQLPVIIGSAEAQSMMIEMRGIVPPRPLTHTLFASVLKVLEQNLLRVYSFML